MARNGVLGGGAYAIFHLLLFTMSLTVESHFKSLCIIVPKRLTWLTCLQYMVINENLRGDRGISGE